jgi:hypothetical protein
MTRLLWDQVGERLYETGTDRGVLYLPTSGVYDTGYAWNGLTAVTESPSGAEATPLYADNIKYLNLISLEEFGGTIEAYTYPEQFCECDGTAMPYPGVAIGQQNRRQFGFSYRTRLGNDTEATDFGYKIHLVYGAQAAPTEKAYATINDSPEAVTFSWEFWTTPVDIDGYKPSASITIDSTKVDADALAALEDMLYGTGGTDPMLPLPSAVLAMFDGTITLVTPGVPTYNSSTDIVTIPGTTGVVYHVSGAGVVDEDDDVVTAGAYGPITANIIVNAVPADGYAFNSGVDDDWLITFA